MSSFKVVEYIWIDGVSPVAGLRSKTRLVQMSDKPTIDQVPQWSFDGSSTCQAIGSNSDLYLLPVKMVKDPLDNGGDFLVMCEVFENNDIPHPTNSRARLRETLDAINADHDSMFGFEQEYTMFAGNVPVGWPERGTPGAQGPYYCSVGTEHCFGREIANKHRDACIEAGLIYYGMNAEVMPGQWEFQIGYRGDVSEDAGALNTTDHVWLGRWLLHRISEDYDVRISFENKPVKGDWNGAGMHTNFSHAGMRDPENGIIEINNAISRLSENHHTHIKGYGDRLEERLTGLHETSSINEFSSGYSDRGRSIRVPKQVAECGYGYLEDRRPGANADPYVVANLILSSILIHDKEEKVKETA